MEAFWLGKGGNGRIGGGEGEEEDENLRKGCGDATQGRQDEERRPAADGESFWTHPLEHAKTEKIELIFYY